MHLIMLTTMVVIALVFSALGIHAEATSRETFNGITKTDLTFKDEPVLGGEHKYLVNKWTPQKSGVYTTYTMSKTGKLAFMKCMRYKDSYKRENRVYNRLAHSDVNLANRGLPSWAPTVFLERYAKFRSANGYGCIVLSTVPGGRDLFGYIKRYQFEHRQKYVMHVFRQLVVGLAYLDALRIAHNDIKPENVLVHQREDGPPYIKIFDFDLSYNLAGTSGVTISKCSTYGYCPPEIFSGALTGLVMLWKVDAWPLGVLMYAYITDALPIQINEGRTRGDPDDV
ncbi:kinase-like domain-containing protein [Syncephalis pseudoplumigaleata]|uniref:Kinase-like domain-containing protein n=1 Tax=Syncephalis pseudoplumigaleata TaxID=1712513 RepID=A0A4P9Z3J9_9FUNG|nr:kinase-like domain-containing protein [Syncephalis pseudoplumigaleata]|eukprot:RKP26100.1 kinase-like domain-containing protein [Syncephalis pseudoplumigaleata]